MTWNNLTELMQKVKELELRVTAIEKQLQLPTEQTPST